MQSDDVQLAVPLLNLPVQPFSVPSPWKLEELRELAARAALTGIPLQFIQDDYQNRLSETMTAIAQRAALYEKPTSEAEERAKAHLQEFEVRRTALLEFEKDWRVRLREARSSERHGQALIHGLIRKAHLQRSSLVLKEAEEQEALRHAAELRELEHQKTVAEEKAKLHHDQRTSNAGAIQQLLKQAQMHLEESTSSLNKLRALNEDLQLRGFTWPVSRFLVWASAVSIVGVAALFVPILDARVPKDGGSALNLNSMRSVFNIGTPGVSIFDSFGKYLLLTLAMLSLLVITVCVVFHLLRRMFPEWGTVASQPKPSQSQPSDELSEWVSLFQIASPSVARRLANVSRKTFIQLIALSPLVLACALGLFVYVLFGGGSVSGSTVTTSLKSVYVALLYTVLASSSGLLFVVAVLRPLIAGHEVKRVAVILYTALFVCPIAALIAAATLPAQQDRLALAFLCAAGIAAFVAGHGLYAQGLFVRSSKWNVVKHTGNKQ